MPPFISDEDKLTGCELWGIPKSVMRTRKLHEKKIYEMAAEKHYSLEEIAGHFGISPNEMHIRFGEIIARGHAYFDMHLRDHLHDMAFRDRNVNISIQLAQEYGVLSDKKKVDITINTKPASELTDEQLEKILTEEGVTIENPPQEDFLAITDVIPIKKKA